MTFVTRLADRAERTIASARVVLAVSTLFAIWLDPSEPSRNAGLTYALLSGYVLYAVALAAASWRSPQSNLVLLASHVTDIALFAYLLVLTQGPASPLFVYFVFSLFCGALRWGWRGALATTAGVLATFIGIGIYTSRMDGASFELNRFIIRIVYLAVVSAMLVFLGRHEERRREEIAQLARWPRLSGDDVRQGTEELLRYAMTIVGATQGVLVWETGDEPWLHVRACGSTTSSVMRYPPTQMPSAVAGELSERAFLAAKPRTTSVTLADGTTLRGLTETALHPQLEALLPGAVLSAPFRADHVSGRVLFSGLQHETVEALPLTAIVARELGAALEQLCAGERARDIAIGEERIRLARDLHDGVLQALTGVRLEIQSLARDVEAESAGTRDRLLAIERAIALEQRELRGFIAGLKPHASPERHSATAARLQDLVQRTERHWRLPVQLRITPADLSLTSAAEHAVSLLINEAIANAARHAHPSRVSVDVTSTGDTLQVVVTDDGRGFPFKGRFDHERLRREGMGPVSLRDRLTAMDGTLTIESTAAGSRLEIAIPLERGAA